MVERNPESGKEYPVKLGKQIVLFMGPEGSGKTTLAKRLASASDKPSITISDILRDLAKNDQTAVGDECRSMFAESRYLNPHVLLDILSVGLNKDHLDNGFILDGGLRTIEEVQGYPDVLQRANKVMPVRVVHLRIPAWKSIDRLVTGEHARREDRDSIEGVLNRLSNYYRNLGKRATLIQKQENWSLHHIDANGSIDETFERIVYSLTQVEN